MELLHNAPVSWPLGVQSAGSFTQNVRPTRRPRARTAPPLRITIPETTAATTETTTATTSTTTTTKRGNQVKKGEPLEDLSPRMARMLQKQGMVLVQPDVPVLRDVLEILTCNSTDINRSRAHSADRVQIMEKTAQKRGVPLTAAEVELKTSRRFRHPERPEANLPVSPMRLVKSAKSRRTVMPDIQEHISRHNEKETLEASESYINAVVSDDLLDDDVVADSESNETLGHDNVPGETQTVSNTKSENSAGGNNSQNETKEEQITNVLQDSSVVDPRENVPTIASGAAGAPPAPPSTPELKQKPVTPVEKALKHNSATYVYKRNQRKSRAQSIAEANRIVYETHVETVMPFQSVKANNDYNRNLERFNQQMNIMSRSTFDELYKPRGNNSNIHSHVSCAMVTKQMTLSSQNSVLSTNKRTSQHSGKNFVSVTTIRPFTKAKISPRASTLKYVSPYGIHKDSVTTPSEDLFVGSKNPNLENFQKNVPNINMEYSTNYNGSMLNNKAILLSQCAEKEKFKVGIKSSDAAAEKSPQLEPIVIPCAMNETTETHNETKPDTDVNSETKRKKHVQLELTNGYKSAIDKKFLVDSRPKSGILKKR